jgi:hypothetical protein
MKKLFAILSILVALVPLSSSATYGISQSADLERGLSQYFSRVDDALLEPGSAMTVECWVNFESLIGGGAAAYVIASKGTSSGGQRAFVFKVANDGSNNITLSSQTATAGTSYDGNTSVSWSSAPSNGTWYHVAWIRNGTTERYTVDGAQMGTDQTSVTSTINDSPASFGLGAENISGTPGDFFDGKLSLCRFWQETRSIANISANMCNVLGATANLSGEWTLDNVLTDNSGNSLTLANNGSATFSADVPSLCASGATTVPTYLGILES